MQDWLTAAGLSKDLQSEGGNDLYLSNVNPGGIFTTPLRSLQLHLSSGQLRSVTLHQVPISRPIVEELEGITQLLGPPDHIIATEVQGAYPPTFDLRLVYLSKGVELTYFGDLADTDSTGAARAAICLGSAARRDVTIHIAPDLSFMSNDPFDWGRRMGISEIELINSLVTPDKCVPMDP
jgi:hypothetical protein